MGVDCSYFFHQNPEPRDPWTGVFDATPLGAACPQSTTGVVRYTHPDFDNWSEDCLNLNIYTKVRLTRDVNINSRVR